MEDNKEHQGTRCLPCHSRVSRPLCRLPSTKNSYFSLVVGFFSLFLVVRGETLKEYIILARTRSKEKSPMAYLCNWIIKSQPISSHVTVIIFRVSIPPWHNYKPVCRWLDFCIICLQQYISPPRFEPSFPDNGKI